jgi:hypothetical protein
MSGEQEVRQQVGIGDSSRPQSGRPQLADMDGRPFLDGAVPLPEPRTARVGRPSVYSQAFAERIFDEIACGASIEKIAALPAMPSKRTIYNWRKTIPEFRRGYFRAMAFRRFDHIDEIINITRAIGDSVTVEAAKAKIASFQWLIAHDGPATMEEDPGDDAKLIARRRPTEGCP